MARRKATTLGFLRYMLSSKKDLGWVGTTTPQPWNPSADMWAFGPEKVDTSNWGALAGNTMIIVMFYVMLTSWGPWLLGSLYWPVAVIWGLGLVGYMASAKKQTEPSAKDKFIDAVGWSSYEIRKTDQRDEKREERRRERRESKHRL